MAREDWGWKPDYDLEGMTSDMIQNLAKKILEFQNFANVIYIISPDIFTPEKLGLVLGG